MEEADGYRSSEDEDYVPEVEGDKKKNPKKKAKKLESVFGSRFAQSALKTGGDNEEEQGAVKNRSTEEEKTKSTTSTSTSSAADFDLNALLKARKKKAAATAKTTKGKKKTVPFKMPGRKPTPRKPQPTASNENAASSSKKETITITKDIDFAGENIRVEKEVVKGSAEERRHKAQTASKGTALSSIMGMIDKKSSMSTLNKSKMDWEKYKGEEKFEVSHKDSVLEEQEFLQRVEQRVYDKEQTEKKGRR